MSDDASAPIGTAVFFVPIRYWEKPPVEAGRVAEHKTFAGLTIPSWTHDEFLYAYHNGYGHNVYMSAKDTFLTETEAIEERDRRAIEYEAKRKAEFDVWWSKFSATQFKEPQS